MEIEVTATSDVGCLVLYVAGGTLTESGPDLLSVIAQHGPLAALELHGLHPDGSRCRTAKLISTQALAELAGFTAAFRGTMPVDQRDQFDATVKDIAESVGESLAKHG